MHTRLGKKVTVPSINPFNGTIKGYVEGKRYMWNAYGMADNKPTDLDIVGLDSHKVSAFLGKSAYVVGNFMKENDLFRKVKRC